MAHDFKREFSVQNTADAMILFVGLLANATQLMMAYLIRQLLPKYVIMATHHQK